MLSSRVTAEQVFDQFGGTRAALQEDHIAVQLLEPLELVSAARELTREHAFSLRAFASATPATDMLREACEPTRSAWAWVLDALNLQLPDDVRAFVAGEHAGYVELDGEPDDFLARPVLVLDTDPGTLGARQLIDVDEVDSLYANFAFERHGDAWFVRRSPQGRSRFSARRGVNEEAGLHVNGIGVESSPPRDRRSSLDDLATQPLRRVRRHRDHLIKRGSIRRRLRTFARGSSS